MHFRIRSGLSLIGIIQRPTKEVVRLDSLTFANRNPESALRVSTILGGSASRSSTTLRAPTPFTTWNARTFLCIYFPLQGIPNRSPTSLRSNIVGALIHRKCYYHNRIFALLRGSTPLYISNVNPQESIFPNLAWQPNIPVSPRDHFIFSFNCHG